MRRIALILAAVSLLCSRSTAFADNFTVFMTDRPYTTGSYTDYTDRSNTDFSLSETPYLFLHLPADVSSYKFSWWTREGDDPIYTDTAVTGDRDVTLTLDWADIGKSLGRWTVDGGYSWSGGDVMAATGFTFVPEPASAVLFLLGAGAFAAMRKRRRQ